MKATTQKPRREAENIVRREAVQYAGSNVRDGIPVSISSQLMLITEPTLRSWMRRYEEDGLMPQNLGRPGYDCDSVTLKDIRALAYMLGPSGSVAYICEQISWVPRAIVEDVVRACKRELKRNRLSMLMTLNWQHVGRVWAIDWTEPAVIDGKYKTVLVVRDLASGNILLSLPGEAQSAELAIDALEYLFILHGAPLVLKSDNGSEFTAEIFEKYLRDYDVIHLLSPAYYPKYNGAIEAGIGSLKTHIWYEAARQNRVGYWTCDDVEAGRLKANETSRPNGPNGPSPDRMWRDRKQIDVDEWEAFRETLSQERKKMELMTDLSERDLKSEERRAITRALVKCGYVNITRKAITTGIIHAIP
jgi:hypothetical protein